MARLTAAGRQHAFAANRRAKGHPKSRADLPKLRSFQDWLFAQLDA
jgi:hypothetical protein